MNKSGKITALIIAAVVIAAAVLVLRLAAGAISIINGMFNAVLGLLVIISLIVIVVWMFIYAKKKR